MFSLPFFQVSNIHLAEDYANLQDNHRKILEQFENLRGQLRVLKSQRYPSHSRACFYTL